MSGHGVLCGGLFFVDGSTTKNDGKKREAPQGWEMCVFFWNQKPFTKKRESI